jgi:hypothetical protein
MTTTTGSRDELFDAALHLLWSPADPSVGKRRHPLRDSVHYAVELLDRRSPEADRRAFAILVAVLDHQYDAPAEPYHGTLPHHHEDPPPPQDSEPICWLHFDPNWREFIGLPLCVALADHGERFPGMLTARIDRFLRLACDGGIARRLPDLYTNPALMESFLAVFAGHRLRDERLVGHGLARAQSLHDLFRRHNAFDEFNTPTYYGVDLYALDHWIRYSPHPTLTTLGHDLEQQLWRDIARFYHAGLANLCGPFDRAYGMDMRRYDSGLGGYIKGAYPEAPLQGVARPAGRRAPPDAVEHLRRFSGERLVTRTISTEPIRRVATAWLADTLMIGGEDASYAKPPWHQYCPATVHWRLPDGDVGWIRLVHTWPADAVAEPNRLTIRSLIHAGSGGLRFDYAFHIYAPGTDPADLIGSRWTLPGLTVDVVHNVHGPRVEATDNGAVITYHARNFDAGYEPRFELTTRLTAR